MAWRYSLAKAMRYLLAFGLVQASWDLDFAVDNLARRICRPCEENGVMVGMERVQEMIRFNEGWRIREAVDVGHAVRRLGRRKDVGCCQRRHLTEAILTRLSSRTMSCALARCGGRGGGQRIAGTRALFNPILIRLQAWQHSHRHNAASRTRSERMIHHQGQTSGEIIARELWTLHKNQSTEESH